MVVARDYKLVVVGGGGVGKSSLTIQLIEGTFLEEYDPTIEDSYRKQCTIDDGPDTLALPVVLEVLDTAGQDEYNALRENYIKTGEGFLLVYDVTSRYSFEEVQKLYKQICTVKDRENTPIVLLGNKTDIAEAEPEKRQVSRAEGLIMAKKFGKSVVFWETSARMRQHVQEAFFDLVRLIRRQNMEPAIPLNRVIGHIHTSALNVRPPSPNDHPTDLSPTSVIRKVASKASLRSTNTVFSTARKLSNSSSFSNLYNGSNNKSNFNLANESGSINSNSSSHGNVNDGKGFSNLASAFGTGASRILSFTLGRTNNNGPERMGAHKISPEKELRSKKSRSELFSRGRYYSQVYNQHQASPQSPTMPRKLRRQSDNVTGTNTDTKNVFFTNEPNSTCHLYGSLLENNQRIKSNSGSGPSSSKNLKSAISHQQLSNSCSARPSISHRKSMPQLLDSKERRPRPDKKQYYVEPPLPPLPKEAALAPGLFETPTNGPIPSTPLTLPSPLSPKAYMPVPPSPCSPTSDTHQTTPLLSLVIPTKFEQFPVTPDSPSGNGFGDCISRTFNKLKSRIIKSRANSAPEPDTQNEMPETFIKRRASLERGNKIHQIAESLEELHSDMSLTTQVSSNSTLSAITSASHSASIQKQLMQKQHQKHFLVSPSSQSSLQNELQKALLSSSEPVPQLHPPQLPQLSLLPQLPLFSQLSLETSQNSCHHQSPKHISPHKLDAPLPPLPQVTEVSTDSSPTKAINKSPDYRQKTCKIKYSKYQDRYSQQYQQYQKMLQMKEQALKKSNEMNKEMLNREQCKKKPQQSDEPGQQDELQCYYRQPHLNSPQEPASPHGITMGY